MTFGPPGAAPSALNPTSYLNQFEPLYCRVVVAQRAPTVRDKTGYKYGDLWLNQAGSAVYLFLNVTSGSATWIELASGGGSIDSIITGSGTATPSGGAVTLNGTANQISTSASGATITLAVPSTFVAPGSIASTSTITAATGLTVTSGGATVTAGGLTVTAGGIAVTAGNLALNSASGKLVINAATASTASVGVSGNMSGTPGAVTVTTSACTASSVILYSRATTGGTAGQVSITAQTSGSFTLTSSANETSTFNYLIIN